jgi:phage FluMu protein Com
VEDLRKKIAYLQGLAEGLKMNEGEDEARIIKQLIDVVADLVDQVDDLQAAQEDMEDYLDSIDEEIYGEEEDDDQIEEFGPGDDEDDEAEDDDEGVFDDDIDYVEVECPKCKDIICFEAGIVDDEDVIEVTCPNCNEVVYVNDGSMPRPKSSDGGPGAGEHEEPEDDL